MPSKKNFADINANPVYDAIANVTADPAEMPLKRRPRNVPPTAAEIVAAQTQGKTQGRSGCHATRINMAFTPEIHDYIVRMARVNGMSITEFTNVVFKQHMEAHADQYERAKEFIESL